MKRKNGGKNLRNVFFNYFAKKLYVCIEISTVNQFLKHNFNDIFRQPNGTFLDI
jgi:hypothetical protein